MFKKISPDLLTCFVIVRIVSTKPDELAKQKRREKMSKYESRITKNADGSFYALVVRIERDGQENVIHGYKGRHFASMKAAEKSTSSYIAKIAA